MQHHAGPVQTVTIADHVIPALAVLPLLGLLSGCNPSLALNALTPAQQATAAAMALSGLLVLVLACAVPAPRPRMLSVLARWILTRTPLPDGPADAVVMVAYHYPPANVIGAARPHRFARYLRRGGTDVSVVCSHALLHRASDSLVLDDEAASGHPPSRVPDARASAIASGLAWLFHTVERLLLPYHDRMGWLPHAYAAARKALTRHAVIVSTHPPVVTHLVALALKLRTGRPWVADFRDPLWGNPFRTSERAGLIDPLIERAVVRHADALIATTATQTDLLRGRYPAMAGKIHTICNGFDPDDIIVPRPRTPHNRVIISHVGTLYGERTPAPLLHCLHRLIGAGILAGDAVQFRQIGHVEPGRIDLQDPALAALDAMGSLFCSASHLPQHDARQEMVAADILLLLDMNDANPGLQIPAKLFDYIRTGRPILALTPPGSPTVRVLANAGLPYACVDLNAAPHDIDRAVATFLSERHETGTPSATFTELFNAARQTQALAVILKSVRTAAAPA